jgi:hypothetical protein
VHLAGDYKAFEKLKVSRKVDGETIMVWNNGTTTNEQTGWDVQFKIETMK